MGSSVALVNEGEFWTVSGFDGAVRIKDSRGVRMLAKLLGTPNREWHVLDLAEAGEVIDGGDAGELLDKQAAAAYRKRLRELERDRDEAEAHHDPGRLARIRAEIDALEAEISRGIGLGGRPRRAGQASERARVNVQRRMTEALKRIEDAHPPLGAHLKRAVRTGAFCSYAPERDVPSIVTP
jgi:hypothetical protein